MYLFYFLGAIAICLGALSLRDGFRFASYVKAQNNSVLPSFTPFASVIIPCRGIDQGFSENIRAVFHQDYPNYEIVFVTDEPSDPCVSVLQQVIAAEEHQNRLAKLIFSGKAID